MCPQVSNMLTINTKSRGRIRAFVYAQDKYYSFMVVFDDTFNTNINISDFSRAKFYQQNYSNITEIEAHVQIAEDLTKEPVNLEDVLFIKNWKLATRHGKYKITNENDAGGNCDVSGIEWDSLTLAPQGMFPIRTSADGTFWCSNACVPFLKSLNEKSVILESDYKVVPLNPERLKKWESYLEYIALGPEAQQQIQNIEKQIEDLPSPLVEEEKNINILKEIEQNKDKFKDFLPYTLKIQDQMNQLKTEVNTQLADLIKKHVTVIFSKDDDISNICNAVNDTLEEQINKSDQYKKTMPKTDTIDVHRSVSRMYPGIYLKINDNLYDLRKFIQGGKFEMPSNIETFNKFSKNIEFTPLDSVITQYEEWKTKRDKLDKQIMSIKAANKLTNEESVHPVNLPAYKLRF